MVSKSLACTLFALLAFGAIVMAEETTQTCSTSPEPKLRRSGNGQ